MPLWSTSPAALEGNASSSSARPAETAAPKQDEQMQVDTARPDQLKQEAIHSINTYLINGNDSVLPPDELPAPLDRAIEAHAVSLIELIRILRESLTNEEAEVRSLAVQLLSLVVTRFAPVTELGKAPSKGSVAVSGGAGAETSLSIGKDGRIVDNNAGTGTSSAESSDALSLHLPTPAGQPPVSSAFTSPDTSSAGSTKPLFDKQSVLTLSTFFSSKLEDGELVAAELAKRYNASTAPVQATAGWAKQATEGGARVGDKRWLGGTVPRGTEMLAASVVALQRLVALDTCGVEAAKTITNA
jgi:hypothetical protein